MEHHDAGTYVNIATLDFVLGEEIIDPFTWDDAVPVDEKRSVEISVTIGGVEAGDVIDMDRVTGGVVTNPFGGCPNASLQGTVSIDGGASIPNPDPSGCGNGLVFGTLWFYAGEGKFVGPGLDGNTNETTVSHCDAYTCIESNGVTRSGDPASLNHDPHLADATLENIESVVLAGGDEDDVLTVQDEFRGFRIVAKGGDDTIRADIPDLPDPPDPTDIRGITFIIDGGPDIDRLIVDADGGIVTDTPGTPGSGVITGPGGSIAYFNIESVMLTDVFEVPPTPIPSQSQWALTVMALLLAGLLYFRSRRVETRKA